MKEYEVICPSCGNSVPFARRCRKCWADLNAVQAIPEQVVPPSAPETNALQISLERSASANEEKMLAPNDDPFWKARSKNRMYSLIINDPSGKYPNRTIQLADMGTTPGGITLSDWKITRNNDQTILSVYLCVNMMGHDLDQWIHYDLMTGKELGRSTDQSLPPN